MWRLRRSQNNEKHHTEYCSLYLFNNIGKAISHCGTEGRTHVYEKCLVIQTLSRDQTFCPSHALEWKRMENVRRLLFDTCDFFETPTYYCRDNNLSTWSPFCTQKYFIALRKMSSNSPAQVQKSHVSYCQVNVAAIMLCTVSGKKHSVQHITQASVLQSYPTLDKSSFKVRVQCHLLHTLFQLKF